MSSRRVKRGTFHRWCRTCGWKGTYSTATMGDRAKRQHNCERWLAKAAAAERGTLRKASVDRTLKPCLHKYADHQHGTRTAYVCDRCRCLRCTRANANAEMALTRAKAYGRYDKYLDAGPAREHIRTLMAAGMGLKRIVAVSDVSQGMLWKLLYGKKRPDGTRTPTKRVLRTTHDRVMAVQLDLADGSKVPAPPTVLRMRALVALGWSQSKLAVRLGITRSNFHLANGSWQVMAGTERKAKALYDELSMVLPPQDNHRDRISVSRARAYAAQRAWLPPLALDDDRLDDPSYEPGFDDDVEEAS